MPSYNSNPGPDLYDDSPGAASATTETAEPEAPESDENEGGVTATLPKSILAGKDFKPGEEVVLEIVAIHDDEVEVKYAKEKPSEDEGGGEEDVGGGYGGPPSDSEMGGMME